MLLSRNLFISSLHYMYLHLSLTVCVPFLASSKHCCHPFLAYIIKLILFINLFIRLIIIIIFTTELSVFYKLFNNSRFVDKSRTEAPRLKFRYYNHLILFPLIIRKFTRISSLLSPLRSVIFYFPLNYIFMS